MKLFIYQYIEKMLVKADYEFDPKTKSWCARIDELPGVYAQADTVEEVRTQLAEVIEEYILVSLQKGHPLPDFRKKLTRSHA